MTDTAKEHMAWCKKRALGYLDRSSKWYDPKEAMASMISNLGKHNETRKLVENPMIAGLGLIALMSNDQYKEAERFITGFMDY